MAETKTDRVQQAIRRGTERADERARQLGVDLKGAGLGHSGLSDEAARALVSESREATARHMPTGDSLSEPNSDQEFERDLEAIEDLSAHPWENGLVRQQMLARISDRFTIGHGVAPMTAAPGEPMSAPDRHGDLAREAEYRVDVEDLQALNADQVSPADRLLHRAQAQSVSPGVAAPGGEPPAPAPAPPWPITPDVER